MNIKELIAEIDSQFCSPPFPQALVSFDLETWEQIKAALALPKPDADCNQCVNRGTVYGLTQESHCEHCVWEKESWRKDLFKAKGGE
jgi:hypothetical protein